jgi:hypothetical protein
MRRQPKLFPLLILVSASGLARAADERPAGGAGADPAAAGGNAPINNVSAPPMARAVPRDPVLNPRRFVEVEVADPYLEMHTGPGRGYPVTRVVPRGERIDILKSRTDWYKVRDDRGKEGWVDRAQMEQTLLADGTGLRLSEAARRDFSQHPWEAGFQTGNFGGGNVNTAFVGYSLNDQLAVEVAVSQVLGRASNSVLGTVDLAHTFRPDWKFSPFVQIGTGVVRVTPKETIVASTDRTEQVAFVGAGFKYYLSRRFVLRGDYRSYVIFTKRDTNEEKNEWKVGFAFYF